MKYLCKIRYVGTDFCGFQVQPNARTVQGELSKAAETVFGMPCKVTGCSRTDSGVHANCFYITVEPQKGASVPPERLGRAMATHLPSDVAIMSAQTVSEDFHPRYSASGKEYVYVIDNHDVHDPFLVHRAWHVARPITAEQMRRMEEAAKGLVGRHDFTSFMAKGSSVTDTVRTVKDIHFQIENGKISIYISADGFLYNMVRIIVGTLTEVAFGLRAPDCMAEILAAKDRSTAGMTAPPDGLYLNRVFYPDVAD